MTVREVLPAYHKPRHYDLRLKDIDFDNGSFTGKLSIDFDATEAVDTVSLNAVELDISKATIAGTDASDISYTTDDGRVHLRFPFKLDQSKFLLDIDYTGKLSDSMAGFYKSTYVDEKTGEKRVLASTQMEAVDCRRAFPCYDEPAVKATFDVTLTADAKYTILGNMPVKTETVDGTLKTVSFYTTPIMSTYLVAWVIGELEYIETFTEGKHMAKIPVRVYTTPGKSELGRFSLDLAARTLEFLSKTFEIPYDKLFDSPTTSTSTPTPRAKSDHVEIVSFAASAMENHGLITYRSIALLADERTASSGQLEQVAETVAHELSHSWHGNAVTFAWWDSLYLNESFATWVSIYVMTQPEFFGAWQRWEKFVANDLQSALRLDALRSSHPVEVPVYKAQEVDEIFDVISYQKGASLIRMISKWLGEDVFLAGVRRYLKRYAFANATSDDLWSALAEESGKDVLTVANLWVKKIGFPVLTVTDGGRTIEQHRYLSSGDVKPEEDETIWWVPLGASTFENGQAVTDDSLVLTERKVTLDKAYDKFNKDHTGVYRVNYEPEHLIRLGKTPGLSIADRAGLVADAGALSTSGHGKTTAMLSLLENFNHETEYVVWSVIAAQITSVGSAWIFESPETLDRFQSFKRKIFSSKSHELGYEFTGKPDDFVKEQLKALLFASAADADDQKTLEACKSLFANFRQDYKSLNANLRGAVFRAASRHGSDDDFQHLIDTLSNDSLPQDVKLAALRSVGDSTDPARVQRALSQFDNPKVKSQDLIYSLVALRGHRQGVEALEDFLLNRFDAINQRLPPGVGSLKGECIRSCIMGNTDAGKVDLFKKFFADKDTKGFERILEQAYDAVRTKDAWVRRDGPEVAEFLQKY